MVHPTQHSEATLLPASDYAESGCKITTNFRTGKIFGGKDVKCRQNVPLKLGVSNRNSNNYL